MVDSGERETTLADLGECIEQVTPPKTLIMGQGSFWRMFQRPSLVRGAYPRCLGDSDAWVDDMGLVHVATKADGEENKKRKKRNGRLRELRDRLIDAADDPKGVARTTPETVAYCAAFAIMNLEDVLALCLKMFDDDDGEHGRGEEYRAAEAAVRHWAENR